MNRGVCLGTDCPCRRLQQPDPPTLAEELAALRATPTLVYLPAVHKLLDERPHPTFAPYVDDMNEFARREAMAAQLLRRGLTTVTHFPLFL